MKRTIRHLLLASALAGAASVWAADAPQPININTATAEELVQLDGVGPAKAQAIVAWREQNGPFKAAAQLTEVRGIGEKLVEANRDRITLK
ncbi:MAG: ComEA family DNA-binding protein [Spongiibacteraceae bacterium]|nr:ComEA family DNA-binding protein [Spongiibacteraceae bacterium]